MAHIQIFEPGLCCGTGICGVDVDQALVTFSADMEWARAEGGDIARFNLAQEPLAFVENEVARQFLHTVGQTGLPVTLVDGATVLTGRYPSRAELADWAGLTGEAASHLAAVQPEGSKRLLAMATATPSGTSGSPSAQTNSDSATGLADSADSADAGCCGTGGCC